MDKSKSKRILMIMNQPKPRITKEELDKKIQEEGLNKHSCIFVFFFDIGGDYCISIMAQADGRVRVVVRGERGSKIGDMFFENDEEAYYYVLDKMRLFKKYN